MTQAFNVDPDEHSTQNASVYWWAFAACLLVICFRGWTRLQFPELWAEDAMVFYTDVLKFGNHSLIIPLHGSSQFLQRLIPLVITNAFPVSSWAFANTFVCFVIAAGIAATIVRPGHGWIIPSLGARVAVALMLCFAPGLNEMLGNLCNLNWMLLLWLALLGLRSPSQRISWSEIIAAVIIIFSVGTGILLIPLFAWRVISTYKQPSLRSNRAGEIFLFALCFFMSAHLALSNKGGAFAKFPEDLFTEGPRRVLEHIARLLFFTPWLGMDRQNYIWQYAKSLNLHWVLSAGVLYLIVKQIRKIPWNPIWLVLIYVGGIALWPPLNWIARPVSIQTFMHFVVSAGMRYSYPLSAAAFIFWMSLIRPERLFRGSRGCFAAIFIGANLIAQTVSNPRLAPRLRPAPHDNLSYWNEFAPVLERSLKTGCPANVYIQAYPVEQGGWKEHGWGLYYHSPLEKKDCPKDVAHPSALPQ